MFRRDPSFARRVAVAALAVTSLVAMSTGTAHADDEIEDIDDNASGDDDSGDDDSGDDDSSDDDSSDDNTSDEPEVGEVDGAVVAVGLPPVPPVADDEPEVGEVDGAVVAVGLPPVPPVADDEPEVGEVDGAVVAVGRPPAPPTAARADVSAKREIPAAAAAAILDAVADAFD